ncbi:ribulose-phosphate 3-epimerase [Aquirufa nivalisilvae]|uniref:ribulose-phosphate 3-epimerase n=1 Tax=Aquirufa nivalisilvae TaxID=2516557 RepID=UPI00103285EC|nr:ribulose-phosphate 3-epimerase [Aquirufa nivalisilvae]MCZ2480197.1 ribulose-phosphate 3-epimerase [Aquirufa nivalisilvae]MCZ2482408.1 ribulose-phosphate 3-epimerase [Aquirufa nivalisilvae]TBH73793.1 ribulose-phosphate 3-epimerase [Aquirufa nivalisilvae]
MESLIIAPSILAANFAELGSEIDMLNASQAEWIHVDVMDGMFVPNISFGFPVLEAVNKRATKVLDVHLMIEKPERYLEAFAKAGAQVLTVHYETCPHLHRTIQQIKDLGCIAGVALNPSTPVQVLEDIISDVDLVLIMSVNPGFGGQKFIPNAIKKTKELAELAASKGLTKLKIEIDGGVSMSNAADLIDAGANVLVAGNFVFSSSNPMETIANLVKLGN